MYVSSASTAFLKHPPASRSCPRSISLTPSVCHLPDSREGPAFIANDRPAWQSSRSPVSKTHQAVVQVKSCSRPLACSAWVWQVYTLRRRSTGMAPSHPQTRARSEAVSFLPPLPDDLLGQILSYLDGNSLGRWPQISHLAPSPRDEVWERVAKAEFSWLYHAKPSRFESYKDFYLALREASARQQDLSAPRRGGIWVLGGCDLGRDEPISEVTLIPDVGGAKVAGKGYPVPLWTASMPSMLSMRSALGVTRDLEDRLVAIGGWSGEEALASAEVLDPAASNPSWAPLPPLQRARCFLASVTDLEGRLHAFGGGDSVWQGADVFKCSEVLSGEGAERKWRRGVPMNVARCGLGACVTAGGDVVVVGGYEGGISYLASGEVLAAGGERFVDLPKNMMMARTGLGLAYGPDHCIYAVGGSGNGLHSHRSVERVDLRVGAWERIGSMVFPRGYCAAAFAPSGLLYAIGGQTSQAPGDDDLEHQAIECLDLRRPDRWRILQNSEIEGVSCVDLGAVFGGLAAFCNR